MNMPVNDNLGLSQEILKERHAQAAQDHLAQMVNQLQTHERRPLTATVSALIRQVLTLRQPQRKPVLKQTSVIR